MVKAHFWQKLKNEVFVKKKFFDLKYNPNQAHKNDRL